MDHFDDELVILQRSATELVIYCRLAGIVVTVSWPTHNGVKIKASVNITEVHDTCLLTSEYPELSTLARGKAPDMDILLVAFTLHGYPQQDLRVAPHFEGYAGEHNSGYPAGTHQLSGPLLTRRPSKAHVSRRRRQSSPYRRYQRQVPTSNARYVEIDNLPPPRLVQTAPTRNANANAKAGPSRIPMDSASGCRGIQMEGKEGNMLQKLIAGQGISEGLIEKCSMCGCLLTASALKGHIKKCLGVIDLS
ncbi:hypothetical protein DFH08DRAFT_975900 [Mycena albidolilacea]|uniref:Uncharacterized protein n=1 Tax=Mycena albidolilacea TaxID=1033008 RepID=A0AAD6Z401_9AGAR|nr:hypothetical protein DFH08DRAFT_975900 [Mycena albidolilacea]